jgi:preprotein translocase subunit SecA
MIVALAKKIFGTSNERILKKYAVVVQQINALETGMQALSDDQLRGKTTEFRARLAQGTAVNDLLPEAFAVCREAGRRALSMRHFDVQLVGGMVLHDGCIAEMKTGEGKTLVATAPVYLNALAGAGVHVVTVNDYLARRDAEWMGKLYKFLGLTVGVIVHGLTDRQRKEAYATDITYGTNNEFGFDYLRDNMKFSLERMVQRRLSFAIVDEVDSILIDEARTPLIISGPSEPSTDKYVIINRIIPGLEKDRHYKLDEKSRSATLTDEGVAEVEKRLSLKNLYDVGNIETLHHVTQALKAHTLFKCDVDYVVKDGEVMIVDEFTGRILPGRRWSDGLHQAVEAKEGVKIESENQTLASITFQNYFRMFKKLAGMTGTADTEAAEFQKIYNLKVVVIPPNRVSHRNDLNDMIYKTENAKFKAVVEEIKTEHATGRPILVGTVAIEKSEAISKLLTRASIRHNVLNAKQHEREAEIIAQAGRFGAVTVSTNMAGRGTDIVLGGNPEGLAHTRVDPAQDAEGYAKILEEMKTACTAEQKKVLETGGLYVLGTERHESRRIDNQLRGRCGRQGDPGQKRFYISLQDELMRIFGAERISGLMDRIGMTEDEVIEHRWITRAIEGAQKKVEAHNFEIRKNVLEYDDVMNQQRVTVYSLRRQILAGEDLKGKLTDMVDELVGEMVAAFGPGRSGNSDRVAQATAWRDVFGFDLEIPPGANNEEVLGQHMYDTAATYFDEKGRRYGEPVMLQAVKFFMLQTLDELWKDHLLSMDHLRDGIGLRGYGHKDPKQEYKKEGFALFQAMMARFRQDTVERVFKVQIQTEKEVEIKEERPDTAPVMMSRGERPAPQKSQPVKHTVPAVGRNDPCPCGSGKKYKKCCGLAAVSGGTAVAS